MSDTPSPLPSSEAPKPKLSLAPKVAAPAPAAPPSSEEPAPSTAPTAAPVHATPPILQSNSTSTPPALLASNKPKASLKLQGEVHPANPDKFTDAKFSSPMPAAGDDSPSGAIVALSAIAAAAALTFAALLFLKTQ